MSAFLIIVLSGITAGLLQTCLNAPAFALAVYAPMFYSVFSQKPILPGRFGRIKSWQIFVFCSQLTSCSFLLTVYRLMPLPAVIGIAICAVITVLLALWLTLLTCLPLGFLERIKCGKMWDILSFSALYAMGEWLCENAPALSFPWSTVALSTVYWTEFIQSAGLLGPRLTTTLILTINGFIACGVIKKLSPIKLSACICCAALITSGAVLYGQNRILELKNLSLEDGETVFTVIAQDDAEGLSKSDLTAAQSAEHYLTMLSDDCIENADLVLLPETAVPEVFSDGSDEFSGLLALAEKADITVCSGAFYREDGKTYNAVYALTPDGGSEVPYLKQITVPFGESVPFAGILGVSTISPNENAMYSSPIQTEDYTIGCGICIESIYSSVFRQQAKQSCEFFVIPTNDSWFGKSFARYAHYRHSILRAVENQRYVLRSGNCGISAVISPWGEEIAALKSSDKGTLSAPIRTQHTVGMYTEAGDSLFISLCILWLTLRYFMINTAIVQRTPYKLSERK